MSASTLGCAFDIHGGGIDLLFPHHENEIAQSRGVGCQFAKYWMHNGHVRIQGEKMAKSAGNFVTVRDLLDCHDGEVLRFFLLSSHYRSPLNYSEEAVGQAKSGLSRLYTAVRSFPAVSIPLPEELGMEWRRSFHEAMSDDANTPEAMAVLFDLAREVNRLKEQGSELAPSMGQLLRGLAGILGFLQQDAGQFFRGKGDDETLWIGKKLEERAEARKRRDFSAADAIRAELEEAGIVIEDTASGTSWRRR